jgi:hypothetical protein
MLIEMKDGYHPVTRDSVYQDIDRKKDPICIIWQGITPPQGAQTTDEYMNNLLLTIEMVRMSRRQQSVSRIWFRRLQAAGDWLLTYGVTAMIFLFLGAVLLNSFLGG